MELSGEAEVCPQCGARVAPKAQWCSLCLTPVLRQPPRPLPAPARPRAAVVAPPATASAMLVELSVTDRLGGLGGGPTGWLLRQATVTRFALAFVLAGGLALLTTAAVTLLGVVLG